MTTLTIETRIKERGYQSPQRARAGIKQAKRISSSVKKRLLAMVDAWEGEGTQETVVAGVPAGEFEPPPRSRKRNGTPLELTGSIVNARLAPMPSPVAARGPDAELRVVNLNARIRARLTVYGVSLLYAARNKVAVPEDLLEKQGVWETELWQFMSVMGDHLSTGDAAVTVGEILELRG